MDLQIRCTEEKTHNAECLENQEISIAKTRHEGLSDCHNGWKYIYDYIKHAMLS